MLYRKDRVQIDKPQGTLYRVRHHSSTTLPSLGRGIGSTSTSGRSDQRGTPDYINMVNGGQALHPGGPGGPAGGGRRASSLTGTSSRWSVTRAGCRGQVHLPHGGQGLRKPSRYAFSSARARITPSTAAGRGVSAEEAMEIIRMAGSGLIHVAMNKAYGSHIICNCCEDCCVAFAAHLRFRHRRPQPFPGGS